MRAQARSLSLLAACFVFSSLTPAWALDKQGASHARTGQADAPPPDVELSGNVFFGGLPYNPTYAARPDNTGHALLRAGGHLDFRVLGPKLFFPIDINMFTDRDTNWVVPSELDFIGGVATSWDVLGGQGELGTRYEIDAPVDRAGDSQHYVDARAHYAYSLAHWLPSLDNALGGGDVAGSLTLGWFAWNPTYFARPNNTGNALLRYGARVGVSSWQQRLGAFMDAAMFTDREISALRPSELDLTTGVTLTLAQWELQVAYERDMPVDGRGDGFVQHMVLMAVTWSFSQTLLERWNRPAPAQY